MNVVVLRHKVLSRHVFSVFPALFILFLEIALGSSLLVGLYCKSDLYHLRRADCGPYICAAREAGDYPCQRAWSPNVRRSVGHPWSVTSRPSYILPWKCGLGHIWCSKTSTGMYLVSVCFGDLDQVFEFILCYLLVLMTVQAILWFSVVPLGCRMRNNLKQVTGCVGTSVEGHQQ